MTHQLSRQELTQVRAYLPGWNERRTGDGWAWEKTVDHATVTVDYHEGCASPDSLKPWVVALCTAHGHDGSAMMAAAWLAKLAAEAIGLLREFVRRATNEERKDATNP